MFITQRISEETGGKIIGVIGNIRVGRTRKYLGQNLKWNCTMKAKKVTISMTEEIQTKAKADSKELFGKENLSGYIQVLIQNGFVKTKRSEGKNKN